VKGRRKVENNVVDQKGVWKKKVRAIGEVVEVEQMNETKRKVEVLDGEEIMMTSLEMKRKDVLGDGETVKSVKWINGVPLKIEKMIEEVAEIVIWTVLAHHEEGLMQEGGDVMTEEMIDLHQIEREIDEEIEVEEGLMIVTVILNVVHREEETAKTAGDVQMIETTEDRIAVIEMVQCEEEEMIEVPAMIEAPEVMVVALEVATIVVHEEEGMIVAEEMTEVLLTGGLDQENLIETKSLKWEIVTVVMTVEIEAMVVVTIGDQAHEWAIEKEVDLAIVDHQQMISKRGVISQQMGKMENGKPSVNVNHTYSSNDSWFQFIVKQLCKTNFIKIITRIILMS